ncbi:MAG: outer membrane beta-barrel protein [Terricaulis sp.]
MSKSAGDEWRSRVQLKPSLTVLSALLFAMTPFNAFAQDDDRNVGVQDRARPEYDPMGLRFGGFDLNASLDLTAENTDNLFATETAEQEDTIYSVAPSATLASHWSRHALVVSAGADSRSHQDYDSEDTDTGYASVYGRLDISTDTALSATVRGAHEVEPRTGPDSLVNATGPVEYDRNEVSVSAQHIINRVRVIGTATSTEYDFEDAVDSVSALVIDQDFRDRSETALTGRVEVAISPRVSLVGQYTGDERDYDAAASSALDSEGQTILAGVRMDLTNVIRGEVTAGQVSRDYDSGTVDGVAIDANLEWFVTGLTTISVTASRDVQEGSATISDPYVNTQLNGRIDHELLRNFIISADVGSVRREYEAPVDREDETLYGSFEARYLMNRRVALRAGYVHEENETSGVNAPIDRNFDANRFFAGITLRL